MKNFMLWVGEKTNPIQSQFPSRNAQNALSTCLRWSYLSFISATQSLPVSLGGWPMAAGPGPVISVLVPV